MEDNPQPKIWMGDAMPGYDELLLDRPNPRYTDREEGAFFEGQLTAALAHEPTWLRIYTWKMKSL